MPRQKIEPEIEQQREHSKSDPPQSEFIYLNKKEKLVSDWDERPIKPAIVQPLVDNIVSNNKSQPQQQQTVRVVRISDIVHDIETKEQFALVGTNPEERSDKLEQVNNKEAASKDEVQEDEEEEELKPVDKLAKSNINETPPPRFQLDSPVT